jgi:hypothetical protein
MAFDIVPRVAFPNIGNILNTREITVTVSMREITFDELDMVAGGGLTDDLIKIGIGLSYGLIGGPIASAAALAANAYINSLADAPGIGDNLGSPL